MKPDKRSGIEWKKDETKRVKSKRMEEGCGLTGGVVCFRLPAFRLPHIVVTKLPLRSWQATTPFQLLCTQSKIDPIKALLASRRLHRRLHSAASVCVAAVRDGFSQAKPIGCRSRCVQECNHEARCPCVRPLQRLHSTNLSCRARARA